MNEHEPTAHLQDEGSAGAAGGPLTLGNSNTAGVWTIGPIHDTVSLSTIYNAQARLYASVDQPVPGKNVTGASQPYDFQMYRFSEESYAIHVPDQDFYWDSNSTILPHIQLVHESEIIGDHNIFQIVPVI
ncbi:uncharacterized protein BX664DRAFT_346284 [Halteromyces radiatus]|uniref:uncharacterized protein n=1 Tax=Halteromyces radiatus TaxID=101107 RepID=UPI00221FF9B3|nr:uncharacterized protein BX664DRAFT_346284 [Halteromyces radiatus]KAI8096200.1 hypothetical protein BX664DRAFT_346284 [Halteromyces radiatus]